MTARPKVRPAGRAPRPDPRCRHGPMEHLAPTARVTQSLRDSSPARDRPSSPDGELLRNAAPPCPRPSSHILHGGRGPGSSRRVCGPQYFGGGPRPRSVPWFPGPAASGLRVAFRGQWLFPAGRRRGIKGIATAEGSAATVVEAGRTVQGGHRNCPGPAATGAGDAAPAVRQFSLVRIRGARACPEGPRVSAGSFTLRCRSSSETRVRSSWAASDPASSTHCVSAA